ncbi:nrg1p [Saccharomyces arboricola H-6]|uniref:Nrg1p n=1 Tax=Saccharomyces arboricola (strain H-6 / AS 2.3317 / CBS 10644) TaxID=1160507 RepID=J8Q9K1_SACAR|nr:nrg1p [Saccharomyces arboricola H-6]
MFYPYSYSNVNVSAMPVLPGISAFEGMPDEENIEMNSERKYQTLLPVLTNSHVVENELKNKLNKTAFDFRYQTRSEDGSENSEPKYLITPNLQMRSVSFDNSSLQYNSDSSDRSSLSQPNSNLLLIRQSDDGIVSNDEYNKMANRGYFLKSRKQRTDPRNTLSDEEDLEQRRKYICKTCARGFTTSGHLARHNRIHTGEKNHCCPYKGCTQRFSRHDNCLQHYRTHLKKGR